jgi:hypothetical protein
MESDEPLFDEIKMDAEAKSYVDEFSRDEVTTAPREPEDG